MHVPSLKWPPNAAAAEPAVHKTSRPFRGNDLVDLLARRFIKTWNQWTVFLNLTKYDEEMKFIRKVFPKKK